MADTFLGLYSPNLVKVMVDTTTLTGFAADTPVKVERMTADTVKAEEGLYGDLVAAISTSRAYIVTLVLMEASRSHQVLQDKHELHLRGLGKFPFKVVDLNNDTAANFTSPFSLIMKVPNLERGIAPGNNEYKLLCGNGTLVRRGMLEAS